MKGHIVTCFLLWICVCLQHLRSVSGHPHELDVEVNLDHETHLYFHLLDEKHYVKYLRPAASLNDSVVVDLDLALIAVHGLETSSGTLESTVRLQMTWQDPRLKWNASVYGSVKEISVPANEIWTPDTHLFSTYKGSSKLVSGKNAMIRHDGVVTWLCDVMLHSLCPVDLGSFPFDSQTCVLSLQSSSPDLEESIHLHIATSPPGSAMDSAKGQMDISMSGEWLLAGDEMSVTSEHSVELRVRLVRKSQLYQCLVVGPVVLLALLVPCVFLLPADSGAKIVLGGLIQVSICICLRSLCDLLHNNHGSVPSIAIFSVASLALTSVSIVMAAFVMSLAARNPSPKPAPAWMTTAFLGRCGLRRWLCMEQQYHLVAAYPGAAGADRQQLPLASSLKNGNDVILEADDADATSLKGSDSGGEGGLNRAETRSLKALLGRYALEQQQQQQQGGGGGSRGPGAEWSEIARVVDRLLFVVFVLLFMLTSVSLLG